MTAIVLYVHYELVAYFRRVCFVTDSLDLNDKLVVRQQEIHLGCRSCVAGSELLGPNGSGKSRFAARLLDHFKKRSLRAHFLGTDRLREMANPGKFGMYFGDHFATGYAKSTFAELRNAGEEGSGVDTILGSRDTQHGLCYGLFPDRASHASHASATNDAHERRSYRLPGFWGHETRITRHATRPFLHASLNNPSE